MLVPGRAAWPKPSGWAFLVDTPAFVALWAFNPPLGDTTQDLRDGSSVAVKVIDADVMGTLGDLVAKEIMM
jgi:hypothetical protein